MSPGRRPAGELGVVQAHGRYSAARVRAPSSNIPPRGRARVSDGAILRAPAALARGPGWRLKDFGRMPDRGRGEADKLTKKWLRALAPKRSLPLPRRINLQLSPHTGCLAGSCEFRQTAMEYRNEQGPFDRTRHRFEPRFDACGRRAVECAEHGDEPHREQQRSRTGARRFASWCPAVLAGFRSDAGFAFTG
jgi:hypothetical protein